MNRFCSVLQILCFLYTSKSYENSVENKVLKREERGVAQVQLQGVPHVQCPMRPPPQVTPHLRYSNKLDISLPRSTRYSDCSYGPISVYSGYPPQLHIGLQQISDLSRVLYSRGWFSRYWAEVKSLDFRSRPRSGLESPCLRLLLSDKSFSSLFFSHICSQCVAK